VTEDQTRAWVRRRIAELDAEKAVLETLLHERPEQREAPRPTEVDRAYARTVLARKGFGRRPA
jgi:hypothetical protein